MKFSFDPTISSIYRAFSSLPRNASLLSDAILKILAYTCFSLYSNSPTYSHLPTTRKRNRSTLPGSNPRTFVDNSPRPLMTATSPELGSGDSLGVPDARQLQYRRNRHHVVISSSRPSEFWVLNSIDIVSVFLSYREWNILRLGFLRFCSVIRQSDSG
jgi:hypothetical protein